MTTSRQQYVHVDLDLQSILTKVTSETY